MRSIFDQYEQPENRLTHALAVVLDKERALLLPFLKWIGVTDIPKANALHVAEQQIPGLLSGSEEMEQKGLPDITVYDSETWAVLFESKVQASAKLQQLQRHRETAERKGFERPWVVMIAVGELDWAIPRHERIISKTWQDVYSWFNCQPEASFWATELCQYMRVFEQKMLAQEYNIKGTITVFDGLRFNEKNPYTYREGKRLIRLMGENFRQRDDLRKLGIDPDGKGRPAITGSGTDTVWDFLPLRVACNSTNFTAFPHLTMSIGKPHSIAAITVPNSIKGGFRSKLKAIGRDGFMKVVTDVERGVRSVLQRSPSAKPFIYATQRHYLSQRSKAIVDGRLEADLRTARPKETRGIRFQPQWIDAIYELLTNKRSNIQFGIEVQFDYSCPRVQSVEVLDLFADSWIALSPLLSFVLED